MTKLFFIFSCIIILFFFFFVDFSLTEWKAENGVASSLLTAAKVALLQEDLGIAEYMSTGCSRQSGNYIPHSHYWSDGKVHTQCLARVSGSYTVFSKCHTFYEISLKKTSKLV